MRRLHRLWARLTGELGLTYAPFCSDPSCDCRLPFPEPCPRFEPGAVDSAGVERCACCGHLRRRHPMFVEIDPPLVLQTLDARRD